MDLKTCSKCNTELPRDTFVKSKGFKDGLHPWCKPCRSAYYKAYDRKRPRKKSDSTIIRSWQLKNYYGMTLEQFAAMYEAQGGKCALCPRVWEEGTKQFAVDHDHACCPGVKTCGSCVRGILCNHCNQALGMVNDDPDVLRAMIAYLEG